MYIIATCGDDGGGDGGGDGNGGNGSGGNGETASVVHEENIAAAVDTTTATKPEKEAAPAKTATAEAGTAAPSSEPEVIPLFALPALAKEFAAGDTPSEEEPPQKPDLAPNKCGQAAETGALQEGGDITTPVPPSKGETKRKISGGCSPGSCNIRSMHLEEVVPWYGEVCYGYVGSERCYMASLCRARKNRVEEPTVNLGAWRCSKPPYELVR